ncbi:MAG: CBS domain-containing protein [Dehalococcoidia bacterium]
MAKVEDIMTKNLSPVTPSTSIREVARRMRDSGSGVIPVCEHGKLRGLITDKAIVSRVVASDQDARKERAGALMSNDGPKVPLGCDAVDAAKIMATHGAHYIAVVQNGGRYAGLLTLTDLIKESMVLASMVLATSETMGSSQQPREKVKV